MQPEYSSFDDYSDSSIQESNEEGNDNFFISFCLVLGLTISAFLILNLIPSLLVFIISRISGVSEDSQFFVYFKPIIGEISFLLIPFVSLKLMGETDFKKYLHFNKVRITTLLLLILGFSLLSLSLISKNNCLNNKINPDSSILQILFSTFTLCILPAISEEIFFRGWMVTFLSRFFDPTFSTFMSSIIFAFCHLHSSFFSTLVIFFLSFGWGYSNIFTNSIMPSIMFHFIHNLLLSIALVFFPSLCDIPVLLAFMIWSIGCFILFSIYNVYYNAEEPDEPQAFL